MSPLWTIVIPVKPASIGKSRLGLGPELARAIALDTVAAAVACSVVGRVLVVTADTQFRPPGVEIVAERAPAGIDAAIRTAAALVAPGSPHAALLGDLPSLRPDDLAEALDAASRFAAPGAGTFVADREQTGTTLVTAPTAGPLRTAFGPGSAAAHRALGLTSLDLPPGSTLAADVDTREQFDVARALGLGPATRAALAASDAAH